MKKVVTDLTEYKKDNEEEFVCNCENKEYANSFYLLKNGYECVNCSKFHTFDNVHGEVWK